MRGDFTLVWVFLAAALGAAPAPGQDNPIVRENRRAGSTAWLLNNHADVRPYTEHGWRREKAIEGYCSHASIRAGETLTVHVSADPASEFQIDFYRLGYYRGKGGRHMLSRGPLQGAPQPTPKDGAKALVECRWKPSLTLEIPRDWLSGVYLGKLTALDSNAQAYVVFIVRDDRKADLLFQCSDITWQSYNRWPAWRSLYDFGKNRWHTSPGNDVGFDRPYGVYYNGLPADFAPLSNGSGEFLLFEFPLAFWLEKEGYDVTYISNLDTHADGKGLLRGKGFLSVGHDEYWTRKMYDNVARARDEGVGLAFLSGNSVSGQVYLNPSTDGRPDRVFGRERLFPDEQELMGAKSYGVGMADWVCDAPEHWVFAATGMKQGEGIPDLVGWEYHGPPLGAYKGLAVVATSPIRGRPKAQPHAATVYDGPKGNVVFNAGTCWWNMVLATPPGFVNPPKKDFGRPDPRVQRITHNVLRRMIHGAKVGAHDGEKAKHPAALAEGRNGVVVGTSGPMAVAAGVDVLKQGGTAADAAMAACLAQVVECGGSYVSHAGILGMVYYEADAGKVHFLNAAYNTPREEKYPKTIPGRGKPSGRTALVPGFMAGVQAAHDRFGKLPRKEVFAPAVKMADEGFKVNPMLAAFLQSKKEVLSRLPETKRIFSKADGSFHTEGDYFRQPELAQTLQKVAGEGAAYMYTGAWAEQFVAAVRKEGGKITLEDMKAYRVIWEEPLRTDYRGHQVCAPGFSSQGGVAMIEALHLLERADLPKRGHYATSPASLFWLMQISHCHVLGYLNENALKQFDGLDLTPRSRVKRETAAAIWQRMQDGKWAFSAKPREKDDAPPSHSDGVVVVDRRGNLAAVTHSINTTLWGDTGLFVGGVSIPDSAAFQQAEIRRAGPGNRLPDPMCPLIVLKGGKPVLGSSAIGGGLHQRTLQVLCSVLDFGVDPQAAVERPAFLLPAFTAGPPTAQVEKGQFEAKLPGAVRAMGQPVKEVSAGQAGAFRGYWVGVHVGPKGSLRGVGTRQAPLPSVAGGY